MKNSNYELARAMIGRNNCTLEVHDSFELCREVLLEAKIRNIKINQIDSRRRIKIE